MRFENLTLDSELNEFREHFRASVQERSGGVGGGIPMEYLRASQVVGVFDARDRMVAGYIVGRNKPYRLLEFVPETERAMVVPPHGDFWEDCCEITCTWKLPQVSGTFMSAILWPRVLLTVLFSGKKHLLGHNQREALDRMYTKMGPQTLYVGISTYGFHSRLFAYNRPRLVACLFLALFIETPRRYLRGRFVRLIPRRSES
jgi:hypothetical protein